MCLSLSTHRLLARHRIQSSHGQQLVTTVASWTLDVLWCLGCRPQPGAAQLFTRKAAQALFPNQRLQRWCFDVELLYLASRLRIPLAETAVTWVEIPGAFKTAALRHPVLAHVSA